MRHAPVLRFRFLVGQKRLGARWTILWTGCGGRGARRPVSRVLSIPVDNGDGTAIPLGRASRRASRGQPGRRGETAPASTATGTVVSVTVPPAAPIRPCSRWGLPCRPRCRGRGALLPHPFTLARPEPGGLLSVALSLGSPPPAVSRHRGPM